MLEWRNARTGYTAAVRQVTASAGARVGTDFASSAIEARFLQEPSWSTGVTLEPREVSQTCCWVHPRPHEEDLMVSLGASGARNACLGTHLSSSDFRHLPSGGMLPPLKLFQKIQFSQHPHWSQLPLEVSLFCQNPVMCGGWESISEILGKRWPGGCWGEAVGSSLTTRKPPSPGAE